MRENSVLFSPIATPSAASETAMLDSDTTTAKKSAEKKKHPRIVNVLKKSVGVFTITKRILDLRVNLTVGELLASAPAVEEQLTKIIFENEVFQFYFNTLSSPKALEGISPYFWDSIRSPKAKICLEDGSKVTALLDTGAEINVMTRELMEEANLAMRQGPKLELVAHTSRSRSFRGLCEDIKVAIGELKTRHPIFVADAGDHDLTRSIFLKFREV